jgi:integrase
LLPKIATIAILAVMARSQFRIKSYKHPRLKFVVRSKITGKWQRKFFKTKREAETYVELKQIELLNQGKEGMMFPAELRVMAHRAKDRLEPYGKTIDDAAEFYLKHLQAEKRSVPVEHAVDELIANRQNAGLSKLYCGDIKFRLGRFAKAFAGRTVATITTKDINGWLESLEVGPVTRNTFRRDARTLFSFCCDHRYCAENPATSTTLAKVPASEVVVLSVDEARRLIAVASPQMLPYWAIGLFAGLRPSEIRALEWDAVDLDDALITVRSGKTGKKRFVTIQPNLIEWLRPLHKRVGKVVAPDNFRKRKAEDKAAAGLRHSWPTNAMRHSFGSYWLAKFNDVNALALQMGNSPTVIEKHYKRAVRPKEAERYWQIAPSVGAEEKVRFVF